MLVATSPTPVSSGKVYDAREDLPHPYILKFLACKLERQEAYEDIYTYCSPGPGGVVKATFTGASYDHVIASMEIRSQ